MKYLRLAEFLSVYTAQIFLVLLDWLGGLIPTAPIAREAGMYHCIFQKINLKANSLFS